MALHTHASAIYSSSDALRRLSLDTRLPVELSNSLLAQAEVLDAAASALMAMERLEAEGEGGENAE